MPTAEEADATADPEKVKTQSDRRWKDRIG